MSRKISGKLLWAKRLKEKPGFLPAVGGTKTQRLGRRFENSIQRALPLAVRGIWWEYCDFSGIRYCQTDFLIFGKKSILVLEAKNTYSEEAWEQLENLYLPVVSRAEGRSAYGVQICRRLVAGVAQKAQNSLNDAFIDAVHTGRGLLHWTGVGPLWQAPPE